MKKWLSQFLRDESGAETVEWAVVGAMVAGIALGSFNGPITYTVSGLLGRLDTQLSAAFEPPTTHGAAVSSEAKGDSTGASVSAKAKSNPARRGNARR